jgi:G3E family GTPase
MFLPSSSDARRLPVIIVSGFLGSGKTTLVNALLKHPSLAGTAVAVNEFGDVPLDAHLIDHGEDKTVVMANGCLCCNLAGDMEDAVMRIFSRRQDGTLPAFQRLIIEPSGLADPAPIAQAILRNPVLSRYLRFEGIISVVDALFGLRQIADHPEVAKQIAMADALVVTKTDLADESASLLTALKALNPGAELFFATHGEVDPAALLPVGFLHPETPSAPRSPFFAEPVMAPGHVDTTQTITLTADVPLDWRLLETWLRKIRLPHAEKILRIKGLLNIKGNSTPLVIHGVHHVLHPPVALPAWPDAGRRTKIAFITRGMDAAMIQANWTASLPSLYAAAQAA